MLHGDLATRGVLRPGPRDRTRLDHHPLPAPRDRLRALRPVPARPRSGARRETAEDTAIGRDDALRTVTALRDLGGDQASAIALAYYEDMSHAQIAEELDVPLGTVKSRIRDGMMKLRSMLEGG